MECATSDISKQAGVTGYGLTTEVGGKHTGYTSDIASLDRIASNGLAGNTISEGTTNRSEITE